MRWYLNIFIAWLDSRVKVCQVNINIGPFRAVSVLWEGFWGLYFYKEITLKIKQSSSRQLNFPACFQGIRKIVLSSFIHLRPGNPSLNILEISLKITLNDSFNLPFSFWESLWQFLVSYVKGKLLNLIYYWLDFKLTLLASIWNSCMRNL